jgi:hypothetical protein
MAENGLNGYDAAIELIDLDGDLFVAAMAFEEGDLRMYLEHLRKAQAHLTSLIVDAEARGVNEPAGLT